MIAADADINGAGGRNALPVAPKDLAPPSDSRRSGGAEGAEQQGGRGAGAGCTGGTALVLLAVAAFVLGWLASSASRHILGFRQPPSRSRGRRPPAGDGGAGIGRLPELDKVAVLMVGGVNRTNFALAAESTWFGAYTNRLYVTDTDPSVAELGAALAEHALNVYAGLKTVEEQRDRWAHPKNRFYGKLSTGQAHHTLYWAVSQHKYLLGLKALVARYPDAEWYYLFDSDSFVFPRRLQRAVDARPGFDPRRDPVALGSALHYGVHATGRENLLMGGSGALLSAAALAKMNVSECVELQRTALAWNKAAADWRLGYCLDRFGVPSEHLEFMWMVTDNKDCGEHGAAGCWDNYYIRHHHIHTECPLTLHYMSPAKMRASFERAARNGSVCVPDCYRQPEPTGACSCEPRGRPGEQPLVGAGGGGSRQPAAGGRRKRQ